MKRKVAKQDFEYSSLPSNRKELFFDIFKIHWRTILVLAFLLFLTFFPLLVILFFKDNYALSLAISVSDGSISVEDRIATLKIVYLISALIEWASLYLITIPLGGIIRIVRQLTWNEPIFFKEDFVKGVKANIKGGIISATFFGLAITVSKATLFVGDNPIVQSIPLAIFLAVIAPPLVMTYFEMGTYNGTFKSLFKNSILMFIKDAPRFLIFTLILLAPFFLTYIESNLIIKFIVMGAIFLFVAIFLVIIYQLFANYIFDKYINQYHYPEMVKKGMYVSEKDSKNDVI